MESKDFSKVGLSFHNSYVLLCREKMITLTYMHTLEFFLQYLF